MGSARLLQLSHRTPGARACSVRPSLIGRITNGELRHHGSAIETRQRAGEDAAARTRSPAPDVRVLGGTIEHAHDAGRVRLDKRARALPPPQGTQLRAMPLGIAGALVTHAKTHVIRLRAPDGERPACAGSMSTLRLPGPRCRTTSDGRPVTEGSEPSDLTASPPAPRCLRSLSAKAES